MKIGGTFRACHLLDEGHDRAGSFCGAARGSLHLFCAKAGHGQSLCGLHPVLHGKADVIVTSAIWEGE